MREIGSDARARAATAHDAAGAAHPAPARDRASLAALWFGLFGGPVAWAAQTLVNLPVAAHGCYPRLQPLANPTIPVRGVALAVSVAAVAVCVAAALVAWRAWSRTRHEHQGGTGKGRDHAHQTAALETGEGRTRFMALAGFMTSVAFILVTIVHATSAIVVNPCGM